MKAKFVNENLVNLPSEDELKKHFKNEVNDIIDITMSDEGIRYVTYPGSSLKGEIKSLFKKMGWDKFYDIKNIEFANWGDTHEYEIPLFKSESERIAPSFDPDQEIPSDEAEEQEFVENFIDEAVWEAEDWFISSMELEELLEMEPDIDIADIVNDRIEDFFPRFTGEFLGDAFSKNRNFIIKSITDRLS